jgi:hypothetical protein
MASVSLVVMERGSDWPALLESSWEVVAIPCDDDGVRLGTRHGLASVHSRGDHIETAFLACSTATDRASISRRKELGADLLSAVAGARLGRIVLHAGSDSSQGLQQELLSLAQVLSQALRGTSATVCVRFGASPV